MTIDKAIQHLENMKWLKGYDNTTVDGRPIYDVIDEIIDLLKAKGTSCEQVAADYGLTPDGVSFALEQYQKVICEITHSRMSKLSYYADDILSVANDVRCDGCEYKEPYLMTVEEADNTPYVWLESDQGGFGVRRIRIVPVDSTAISIQTFGKPDTICVLHEFEKHFRCWNIKPSDEQRKNTPWKE